MRWVRRLALAAFGLVSLILLTVAMLMTPPGRMAVFAWAEILLSGDGMTIDISGSSGRLPLSFGIDRVTISDDTGPWLDIENVSVRGQGWGLVLGRVEIDALDVAAVRLHRLPDTASPDDDSDGTAIALPLAVRSLNVQRLVLAEEVIGAPAVLALSGALSAWVDTPGVMLTLDSDRIDGEDARLALTGRFDPDPFRLSVSLDVSEAPGGLIQTRLGAPRPGAYRLTGDVDASQGRWQGDASLSRDGAVLLTADLVTTEVAGGQRLTGDLSGDLSPLLPAAVAPYLGGTISGTLRADVAPETSFTIETARFSADGVSLQANGVLSLGATDDDFSLTGVVALPPEVEADPALAVAAVLGRADIFAQATSRDGRSELRLHVGARDANVDPVSLASMSSSATLLGDSSGLLLSTGFDLDLAGELDGARVSGFDLETLFGPRLRLSGAGTLSQDNGLVLNAVDAVGTQAEVGFVGEITLDRAEGESRFALRNPNGLGDAARDDLIRGGTGEILATGAVAFDLDVLDLAIDGAFGSLDLNGLPIGDLLDGEVDLSGRVSRSDGGSFVFRGISIATPSLRFAADGEIDAATLDLTASADIARLYAIDPSLAGAATMDLRASGTLAQPEIDLTAEGQDVALAGRPFEAAVATLTTRPAGEGSTADLDVSGVLDGEPVNIDIAVSHTEEGFLLDRITAQVATATAEGRADLRPGSLEGALALDVSDLGVVGPLLLRDMAGALTGTITLGQEAQFDVVAIDLTGSGLRLDANAIDVLAASGHVSDPFGQPQLQGQARIEQASIAGRVLREATLTAETAGGASRFDIDMRLDDGQLAAVGSVRHAREITEVTLDDFNLETRGVRGQLAAPSIITIAEGITISETVLSVAGGRARVSGTIADDLDLSLTADGLPLSLIGPFVPGLDPRGALTATATILGTPDSPRAAWTVSLVDASLAETRELGLPSVAVTGRGDYADDRIGLDLVTSAGEALRLNTSGSVSLAGRGALDLTTEGRVSLAVVRALLSDSGTVADGVAQVRAQVSGALIGPQVQGAATLDGVRIALVDLGVRVTDISGRVSFDQDIIRVEQVGGVLTTGGNVAINGTIAHSGADGPNLDLSVTAQDAVFLYEDIMTSRFGANLTATGVPYRSLVVAGEVQVAETEIRVPDQLGSAALALDVQHEDADPSVTIVETQQTRQVSAEPSAGVGTLDVVVSAPSNIFVRGRGIDVDLGGRLRLVGPIDAPRTNGAFSMQRGHVDVLARRLEFSRGTMTFSGDFDPVLDLLADTQTPSATVSVVITGRASAPDFAITSDPSLPTEEAMALLLFGRPLDELSGFEIAQLANGVATLGGYPGVAGRLNSLASQLGVDELGVEADDEGNAVLSIGKRLNERLYLGVEQGTRAGETEFQLDLDLLRGLRARGTVNTQGETGLGVTIERDY
ncbi:MAG: translocation/assembly module TamB domain-containing protein [Pseudomonadota bacterium]